MFSSLNSSSLCCATFIRTLTVIACAVLTNPCVADEPALKPAVSFSIATIYSDGNNILMARPTPGGGGEPVQQNYTVLVPTTVNGVTTMQAETRTRTVSGMTPGGGEPVQQTYTVMIPTTVNGVTTMQAETRTRTVSGMKLALLPVADGTYFQNVEGKKLETKDVAIEIPKAGRPVILITDPNVNEIPTEWKLLFNEKAVIMRTRF